MKTKPFIIGGIVVASLVTAGTTYASESLFQDKVDELKSQIAQDIGHIQSNATAYIETSLASFKEDEANRLEKETMEYFEQKKEAISNQTNEDLEQQKEEIRQQTDQSIEDLKAYIDSQL